MSKEKNQPRVNAVYFKILWFLLFLYWYLTGNINQRRWRSILRRVQKKDTEHPQNTLFGRPLSEICQKDGCPPKAIMVRIVILWHNRTSMQNPKPIWCYMNVILVIQILNFVCRISLPCCWERVRTRRGCSGGPGTPGLSERSRHSSMMG